MPEDTLNILVIDDEILNLEIMVHALERAGYNVTCVADGGKALVLLNTCPNDYDLVLLDRMMPEMDGMEMLCRMRTIQKLRHIPVVLQTAASSKKDIEEGIKAGAYYYLTKPYTKAALLKVVRMAENNIKKTKMARDAAEQEGVLEKVEECHFEIRTLEEAELTALYLSNLFPDPDEIIFGITEVLVNAIEHGNLGIDYELKTSLINNGTWKAEVNRRLELPENISKKVEVAFRKTEDYIEIIVKDQGDGFDWKQYVADETTGKIANYGRGLGITGERYFDKMEYIGKGNEVRCKIFINYS